MNIAEAERMLADIESRKAGSMSDASAIEGYQMLLEHAKVSEGAAREHLRRAAHLCLGLARLGRIDAHIVTDWRAVPVELLELRYGRLFQVRGLYADGLGSSVPGLEFSSRLHRFRE